MIRLLVATGSARMSGLRHSGGRSAGRNMHRDFQAMVDRGGERREIGKRLLSLSNRLFRHWEPSFVTKLCLGMCFKSGCTACVGKASKPFWKGRSTRAPKRRSTCFELLKVEEGLWTFAQIKRITPTNNVVERVLWHAVIWQWISGGTDSTHGSRFIERMLTVVATCRQQRRNILDYLTSCFEAHCRGHALPSLLPVTQTRTNAARFHL